MARIGMFLFVLLFTIYAWSQAAKTTVLVRTDMDCKWSLDGVAKGVLKTDARLRVPVGLGQHLVEAKSLDGTLRWEKTFEVNDTNMQVWEIDLQDAPWTDPATKLTWMRRDNGKDVNLDEAADYCQNLTVAGHSDWRLPTVQELFGIKRSNYRTDGSDLVNGHRVKGPIYVTGNGEWSSGPRNLVVGFVPIRDDGTDGTTGFSDQSKHTVRNGLRALCVRGGQIESNKE